MCHDSTGDCWHRDMRTVTRVATRVERVNSIDLSSISAQSQLSLSLSRALHQTPRSPPLDGHADTVALRGRVSIAARIRSLCSGCGRASRLGGGRSGQVGHVLKEEGSFVAISRVNVNHSHVVH